ncbi:Patatin [Rhodoferax lacus]|uniref:Patatin n=1 Tax=Rhodoferax lacus TaxID=2184758 RepID=A0A3E1R9J5_9BURK|nr:patatin-like phospholipase family protein [Rhodoferax lacus]RFO96034.1 Patatin [Rhodoferax lacus]
MHFDTIVFSGGGNRCFWQAGFWSVIESAMQLRPLRVTAVSAGAAMACVLFAGTFESGFEGHKRAVLRNPYNLYVRNLLKAKPVFPHGAMYRAAILASINAAALERLHQGPDIQIVVARPPAWAPGRLAVVLGAVSAGVDALNSHKLEAAAARRLGFRPVHVSVRDCHTPQELADLIVASSCVPPLTPLMHADGMPVLDGGLVGTVPTGPDGQAQGHTLVLLTRPFRRLQPQPGTLYVQPSSPVPVGTWDYTDDKALQAAYELGQSDGAEFFATIRASTSRGSRPCLPHRC